jgi:flagellar motility protein MotE (MotC chaperone)
VYPRTRQSFSIKKGENVMSHTELILAIVSTVVGSGGIASAIVALLSVRKYKAEARILEQQVDTNRQETEQKVNEYIRTQLKELSDTHRAESDELRKQNRELGDKITVLNNRINQLMNWIIVDNNAYRSWLENELLKLKPDIEFPKCKPTPGFMDDSESDESITNVTNVGTAPVE